MLDQPFKQPRLTSNQSHFSQVPSVEIQRSVFNRSHQYKTTFDAQLLIPIFVDEVLPGDSFKLSMTSFARLATPIVPFMDNLFADVFFFFVPNRLVWDNWEKFNGAQTNPGDSTDYLVPQVSSGSDFFPVQSIYDYMGVPTLVTNTTIDSLHLRAYNLIYNEWFRDQNLQPSRPVPKGDGPDTWTDFVIQPRGKRHDYFTSALPWPQKGPAVSPFSSLPLEAPLKGVSSTGTITDNLYLTGGANNVRANLVNGGTGDNGSVNFFADSAAGGGSPFKFQQPGLSGSYAGYNYANLSELADVTVNTIREAFQLQRMFERDARGGTRYVEILKSHFGVTSPDFRLQRPEYLGGGSTMINTSPIPQTAPTNNVTPQGNLAAVSSFSHSGIGFNKSFVEHGMIIGLISVRSDLTYQQGLNRMWSRQTRFDFYWPSLAHLGEQTILNKEIYYDPNAVDWNDAPWGYAERWAEYRYKPSLITGKFRSNVPNSLDFWHLSQDLSFPQLGATFISSAPPVNRVVAVVDEPQFLFDAVFNLHCARPMPVYSVPGLVDHF